MSKHEALSDMGIKNPNEISKYKLHQDGHRDILTIFYKRKKGSILPYSRKYSFSRSVKTIVTDGGRHEYKDVYEISPFLLRAISELDSIVKHHIENSDRKQEMLEDIEELERSMSEKLAELKSILKEMD